MVKATTEIQSPNILLNEKRRWQGIPLWAFILALLQIGFWLAVIPALLKHYYSFLFSLGHPFYVYLITSIGFHVASLIGSNFMMFCIYKAKHPFFEQYRAEPDRLFPWEEDSKKWNSLILRNILVLAFNVLIFMPLIGILLTPDKEDLMFRYELETWPSLWQMVWQIVFCSFCEDFMFYCTHRTLHTRWCFKNVHKRHHEYSQPVSIGGEFAHPFQTFFGNIMPFYLGLVILQKRCHLITTILWGVYRVCESGDAHSGYQFPWSPYRLVPFSAPASYHNYHHTHNKGNYATFFCIWDTIFGTNRSYYSYLEKQEQAKKSN